MFATCMQEGFYIFFQRKLCLRSCIIILSKNLPIAGLLINKIMLQVHFILKELVRRSIGETQVKG